MKAKLIDRRRFVVFNRSGRAVQVVMDLFKIQGKDARQHPDGFRFSWIAFDPENPERRVLFDSYPPKGPHFHIDGDEVGVSEEWSSLEAAYRKFFRNAARHFDIDEEEFK
jgi:hypothetical protein